MILSMLELGKTKIGLWAIRIVLFALACAGIFYAGYQKGTDHQKLITVKQQVVANSKVETKNEKAQDTADKEAQIQIVYRDRIITKYEKVQTGVKNYEKTQTANIYLDPEFVRLHDSAAATNDQVQIAKSASSIDGSSTTPKITTGQAIAVITENYQRYYDCRGKLEGWIRWYSDLQNEVNK